MFAFQTTFKQFSPGGGGGEYNPFLDVIVNSKEETLKTFMVGDGPGIFLYMCYFS